MSPRDGLVYGVGALRAAARGDRVVWALHRAALTHGVVPIVAAGALADAYRAETRADRIDAFLAGVDTEALGSADARRAGELAARAGTVDIVAAVTAELAVRKNAAIVTSRQAALRAACSALGHEAVQYVL